MICICIASAHLIQFRERYSKHFRVAFQNVKHINLMNSLWKSPELKKPHTLALSSWKAIFREMKKVTGAKTCTRKKIKKRKKKTTCCHYILRERYISEDCQHSVGRFDKKCAFPSLQESWCLLNKFKPVTFRIIGCKTR